MEEFKAQLVEFGKQWFGECFLVNNNDVSLFFSFWYPEKVVRNSKGMSHLMRDIGATLHWRYGEDGIKFFNAEGFRLTQTYSEFTSNYGFSHLGSGGHFCFGTGPIRLTNSAMYEVNWTTPDWDLLDVFMSQFSSYFEWESLEGGPYKKIQNIGTDGRTSNNRNISSYRKKLRKGRKEAIKLKYIEDTFPHLEVDEEKLRVYLTSVADEGDLVSINTDTKQVFSIARSEEWQRAAIAELDIDPVQLGTLSVPLKIIVDKQATVEIEKSIHPDILKDAKNEIESSINQQFYSEFRQ